MSIINNIFLVAMLSYTVARSTLLDKPREFVYQKCSIIGELLECWYCTSFWVTITICHSVHYLALIWGGACIVCSIIEAGRGKK